MSGNVGNGSTVADPWINAIEAVARVVRETGWTDVEAAQWLLEAWEADAITAKSMHQDAEWRRQRGLPLGLELPAGACFGRARLLAALEELRSPPEAAAHKSPLSDAKLREWYRQRAETWPADTPPPSERADRDAVAQAFPAHEVTRDRLRAVRAAVAPRAWKEAGRPKGAGKSRREIAPSKTRGEISEKP